MSVTSGILETSALYFWTGWPWPFDHWIGKHHRVDMTVESSHIVLISGQNIPPWPCLSCTEIADLLEGLECHKHSCKAIKKNFKKTTTTDLGRPKMKNSMYLSLSMLLWKEAASTGLESIWLKYCRSSLYWNPPPTLLIQRHMPPVMTMYSLSEPFLQNPSWSL